MVALLRELSNISEAEFDKHVKETELGKPLVGFGSRFIPGELIRAAGANTYYMCRGGESSPAEAALDYTLCVINPLARALVGYVVRGIDPIASHLDLIVTAISDCHISRMSEILEINGFNVSKIGVPADWMECTSFDYYVASIRRMLVGVSALTGKDVDMNAAKDNFALSAHVNDCFRRLDRLRSSGQAFVKFEDYMRLQHFSLMLEGNNRFADLLEAYVTQQERQSGFEALGRPKLLVLGRGIAVGDYPLLHLLDQSGCSVVAQIFDMGIRNVGSVMDAEGDLVENFARKSYLNSIPISSFQPAWKQRYDYIKRIVHDCGIDGIVWYQLADDEIYDMEYKCLARWLQLDGLPFLKIETKYDYTEESLEQESSRLNSFADRLKKLV